MTKKSTSDPLRPSPSQSYRTLARSRKLWRSLLSSAISRTQFPQSCSNIRPLLHNVPSIPQHSDITEKVNATTLLLEGYSQWNISPANHCDIPAIKRSCSQSINIGTVKTAFCEISDELDWTGFEDIPNSKASGNYLCAFVLGWSYVLSARLIELRKDTVADRVFYTDEKAASHNSSQSQSEGPFTIPIGDADPAECRWWAAILARRCGWRAILCRSDREYYPPWACHLDNKTPFSILHNAPAPVPSNSSFKPPSSIEAQTFLCNFARFHNAFDQLIAAFVATLTIPGHMRFGAAITLPKPKAMVGLRKGTEVIYGKEIPTIDEIPSFTSLSCIPNVISSSLFSCFWQPGVNCNLASEWLHPALEEVLPPLIEMKQYQVITCMMSDRRPMLAPLLLGSTITGLLPRIIQIHRTFLPPCSLEGTVWTASPQSFMDPQFYRMPHIHVDSKGEEVLSREDEYRLLYLTDIESQVYGSPPLSPYPPFGVVPLRDAALNVRLHAHCGHKLVYMCWVWKGPDGRTLDDFGMKLSANSILPHWPVDDKLRSPSGVDKVLSRFYKVISKFPFLGVCRQILEESPFREDLSERATRNVFSWTFFADGLRVDELEMWHHEWLRFLLDVNDDGSSMVQSNSPSPSVPPLQH